MDIFDKIKLNRGALGQYSDMAYGYFMFPKLEGEIGSRMTSEEKRFLPGA